MGQKGEEGEVTCVCTCGGSLCLSGWLQRKSVTPPSTHTHNIFIWTSDWEFASLTGFPMLSHHSPTPRPHPHVLSPDQLSVCVGALAQARAGAVKAAEAEVTQRLGRCRPPCFCVPAGWTWQLLSCVDFSYEWGSSQTVSDVHHPPSTRQQHPHLHHPAGKTHKLLSASCLCPSHSQDI